MEALIRRARAMSGRVILKLNVAERSYRPPATNVHHMKKPRMGCPLRGFFVIPGRFGNLLLICGSRDFFFRCPPLTARSDLPNVPFWQLDQPGFRLAYSVLVLT